MKFTDFVAISGDQKNNESILGQLLYMSLGAMLIPRDTMAEIFEKLNLDPKYLPKRLQYIDSFLSATTDISTKLFNNGKLIKIFVRDNLRDKGGKVLSRELVKEIVGDDNEYISLGKFRYDTESKEISAELVDCDPDVDHDTLQGIAAKVDKLFELYKVSYNRNSVETILENLVAKLDASKVTSHGKLYFVPRYKIDEVSTIEALGDLLNENNRLRDLGINYSPVTVNAIFVLNDEKQRKNFEQDFYNTVEKELEMYQERLQHFIKNGSKSEKITEKWLAKIAALKGKKENYEKIFSKALNNLNEEFENVEFLASELRARVRAENFSRGPGRQVDGQISLVA